MYIKLSQLAITLTNPILFDHDKSKMPLNLTLGQPK